jgi:hypothetical protein
LKLVAEPLDGTEPVWVQQGGAWKRTTTAAIAALAGVDLTSFAARLTAVEKALSGEITARQTTDTAQAGRIAALEGRPEEVAHFTGSAKLPAIAVATTTALTLTGLVPAVTGDRVRKGEAVIVEPATALPAGANIAAAYAPADDTVVVQITAGLAISPGAAPIIWNITVLR